MYRFSVIWKSMAVLTVFQELHVCIMYIFRARHVVYNHNLLVNLGCQKHKMEPTPPRKPKENRPFYAPPEDKPIAVQIINEARSSLKELKTKRPFTPRDDKRTLFGPRPVNTSDTRPPSAFR